MSCTDSEVLADVEEWKKNLANYSAQVVGKTLVFLNGSTQDCRFKECNLGNLICDAMVSLYRNTITIMFLLLALRGL